MSSIFAANEPSLGYLYQVRYGLFLIVAEQNDEAELFIEKIDDVSIETPDLLSIYQTKLHIKSIANLTNASSDLWKTLRVWCEGIQSGAINPDHCMFNLITTAIASEGTIPYLLRQGTGDTRDCEEICKKLLEVAHTSTNLTNERGYTIFKSLSADQRKKLISKIHIIDASIDINEAQEKVKKILSYSTDPNRIDALYERLEGWFIGEVILQLQERRSALVGKEIKDKILDIADSLKVDNLPADFTESIASDEDQLSPYRNQLFVKQLESVGANSRTINHAISDYHRAFSQKSKWLRDGLINPSDEINYDRQLEEDWDRKFSIITDTNGQSEEFKKQVGRTFYETHYVTNRPNIHIKERFKEQYMVTGSCQMLSDKKKIGWHPEFQTIL